MLRELPLPPTCCCAVPVWPQPSETDIKRFEHYYNNGIVEAELPGIDSAMLEHDKETGDVNSRTVYDNVRSKLPAELVGHPGMQPYVNKLTAEITQGYTESQKLSILNYILSDPNERSRLKIMQVHTPFPRRTIRAPVYGPFAACSAVLQLLFPLFIIEGYYLPPGVFFHTQSGKHSGSGENLTEEAGYWKT